MCFPKTGPFYLVSFASLTIVKASQVWTLRSSALDLTGDVPVPEMFLGQGCEVSGPHFLFFQKQGCPYARTMVFDSESLGLKSQLC